MSQHLSKIIFFTFFISLLQVADIRAQSAQQLEQFQRLPKAQQEQLAKQMGVDLAQLTSLGIQGQNSSHNMEQASSYPRGTQFDELGNPLQDQTNELANQDGQDEELKLYGVELFANSPSTFSPVDNAPVPAHYLLKPGDTLRVQLYGNENEEYELVVGRDGKVVIPKLGPYDLASKSFSEVKSLLSQKIKQQVIGVEVSVSMGELSTMRIFVMGEAYKPGAYNVSSLSSITQALFVSGGMSDIASLRNIQLKRAGRLIATLDLYDLLNAGDTSQDLQLQAGDVLFIPAVENTITVDGEVRRPAIYELKGQETISDVIRLAGGALATGYVDAISVKRFNQGSQIQLTADLIGKDIQVQNGDAINIPQISPVLTNSVGLIGAVARPGQYQWQPGMGLSVLLGQPDKDLLDIADLSYVLILRQSHIGEKLEVLQKDISSWRQNTKSNDFPLAVNDQVIVFSRLETNDWNDIRLDDLAFTNQELQEQEKEIWQQRIEERLFWEKIGLYAKAGEEPNPLIDTIPLIELTALERKEILAIKDAPFFSRTRLLMPVLASLRQQANFGYPLQLIEVVGEVRVPGVYPLPKGAGVKDAILAAGGLTESAYPLKSEITRTELAVDGSADIRHIEFSLAEVMASKTMDKISLQSRDSLNILAIPAWQDEIKIIVQGQVQFPGQYAVRRGEKLSDIVARFGGVTEFGAADAAVFTRETLKSQERANINKLAEDLRKQVASESLRRQAGAGTIVSYAEAKKLLADLSKAEAVGRLVINFEQIIAGNFDFDLELEDGDKLFVPRRSQSINVIGEVFVPTSHLFTKGLCYQ
jgi:polysaccharide export outer membrane protein